MLDLRQVGRPKTKTSLHADPKPKNQSDDPDGNPKTLFESKPKTLTLNAAPVALFDLLVVPFPAPIAKTGPWSLDGIRFP